MTNQLVAASVHDGVGRLHLDNPTKRNAVGHSLVDQALEAITSFEAAGVSVATLTAEPPVFCSGNDLTEIDSRSGAADTAIVRLLQAVLTRSIYWVSVVDGAALGGGMALAAACPTTLVSDRAWFALPELHVGLFPAGVLPYLEAVIGPRAALDAAVTGRRIDHAEALTLGLASRFATYGTLPGYAFSLASDLASRPLVTDAARQAWQSRFATGTYNERQIQLDAILARNLQQLDDHHVVAPTALAHARRPAKEQTSRGV